MALFSRSAVAADAPPEAAENIDLGLFDPPADFEFPAALQCDPPRPKPAGYALSPYQRRLHQLSLNLAVAAAGCLLFSFLPFVRTLSFYLLPLGYLDWIGAGLGALAVAFGVARVVRQGPHAYIRDGVPVVARVLAVRLESQRVGEGVQHRFAIEIEFKSPDTRMPERGIAFSRNVSSATKYSVDLRPGDYTTAIVSPPPRSEVRLYGLLDADAECDLVLKNGKREEPMGVVKSMGITALIMGVVGLLLLGGFGVEFYLPERAATLPLCLGLGVPALIGAAGLVWLSRQERAGAPDRARRRNVVAFAGAAVGALAGGVGLIVLNAKLDRSTPAYADIEIVKIWQTTYDCILRTYEFEYQPLGGSGTERYPARIENITSFADTRAGIVERRGGAFGMPWIAGLRPCIPVPIAKGNPRPAHTFSIGVRPKTAPPDAKGVVLEFGLMIEMPDGSYREPSPAVAKLALKRLQESSGEN
jgi:hypothetical protein